MTKLILHVGLGKTGTTAFQDAMRDGFDVLLDAGFLCAGPRLKFAVPEEEELEVQYFAREPEHLAKALKALEKATLATPEVSTVVWSNEAIGMAPNLPDVIDVIDHFIKGTKAFDEVEIAICFRRQDEWVESAYRQWGLKHKTSETRGVEAPESWLERNWHALDYLGQYRAWSKLGGGHVRAMTYDAMRDAGGSVPYLFTQFGLPIDLIPAEVVHEKNVSLGPAQSYLNALHNGTESGPVRPVEFARLLEDCNLPEMDDRNSSFISADLRQTILDRFTSDNAALAQQALGREQLFSDAPVGGQVLYENGPTDALYYLSRIAGEHHKALCEVQTLRAQLEHEAEHLANVAARLRDMEQPGYLFRKIKRRLKARFGRGS
jgi:hypothetical protein